MRHFNVATPQYSNPGGERIKPVAIGTGRIAPVAGPGRLKQSSGEQDTEPRPQLRRPMPVARRRGDRRPTLTTATGRLAPPPCFGTRQPTIAQQEGPAQPKQSQCQRSMARGLTNPGPRITMARWRPQDEGEARHPAMGVLIEIKIQIKREWLFSSPTVQAVQRPVQTSSSLLFRPSQGGRRFGTKSVIGTRSALPIRTIS